MMLTPTYIEITAAYEKAKLSGYEPNVFAVILSHKKVKAVRRVIGRYIRNRTTKRGNVVWVQAGNNFGFYKV